MDIRVLYRLNSIIAVNNHTKNFLSYNLVNVWANLFTDLLSILIDFYFFPTFFIFFSQFAIFNNRNISKSLDFVSPSSLATYNLDNIFAIYYGLFVYLMTKFTSNVVLTNSSYFSSDSIEVEQKNCFGYLHSVVYIFFLYTEICGSCNKVFLNRIYFLTYMNTFFYISAISIFIYWQKLYI